MTSTKSIAAGTGGARVELRAVSKSYGDTSVLHSISLDIPAGAFVSFLGPSGSGKTTTLNLIAGFLKPDRGDILFDGLSVADTPPNYRDIGMVFQSYALFPHLTVCENVAFPLRMRTRMSKVAIRQRVAETLELVQMSAFGTRHPRQLSGGQQQRVAMARALVSNPRLLLMDEPLGALDKQLRDQMQFEIKRIHRRVGSTFIYVTHDQSEALTMSDYVVLMNKGEVAQAGTPSELYVEPAHAFVADFIGDSNILTGSVLSVSEDVASVSLRMGVTLTVPRRNVPVSVGQEIAISLRPEDIRLRQPAHAQQDETVRGRVIELGYLGDSYKLCVAISADTLRVKVPASMAAGVSVGGDVELSWNKDAPRLLRV